MAEQLSLFWHNVSPAGPRDTSYYVLARHISFRSQPPTFLPLAAHININHATTLPWQVPLAVREVHGPTPTRVSVAGKRGGTGRPFQHVAIKVDQTLWPVQWIASSSRVQAHEIARGADTAFSCVHGVPTRSA